MTAPGFPFNNFTERWETQGKGPQSSGELPTASWRDNVGLNFIFEPQSAERVDVPLFPHFFNLSLRRMTVIHIQRDTSCLVAVPEDVRPVT